MATDLATLMVKIGADLTEYSGAMDKAGSKLGSFVSSATKASLAVGAALAGVGVAAGKMAADFQADMKNVQSLLGKDAADKVAAYGNEVKRIATSTGKELSDMSDGIYQVISAWGDSPAAVQQLEISAKAAAAGMASTMDAVNLLSAHTKGYGDVSAEATQKAADLAFMTVNLGQTTFPELANTMGRVIPLAATLTVKQEELYGAMATLTGVTGNTAEVTTQLRATMQALINPSSEMAEAMASLGYENGNAMINTLGLQGTLNALAETTGGNTQQIAKMFGSVEALNAVLSLTGNQAADFTNKTKAMYEAAGASTQAFEIQQESVNAMMGRLKQMANVAMVELGEKFLPVLTQLAEWVMANMPAIKAFFEATFNAIGTAIDWVSKNVLPLFQGAFSNSSEVASGAVQFFHDKVVPIFEKVWAVISKFVEAVQLIWAEWGDEIMSIVGTTFDTIFTVIDSILTAIGGVLDVFIGLFTGDWGRMKEGLVAIWEGLWGAIKALVEGAWNILQTAFSGLWDAIKNWFTGLATRAVEWGANMMKGFYEGITGWFQRIKDGIADFVDGITDRVKDALGIRSPSKVFAEIGENVGKGLALGIEDTQVDVTRALSVVMPKASSMQAQTPAAAFPKEAVVQVYLFPDGPKVGEYVREWAFGDVRQAARAMG